MMDTVISEQCYCNRGGPVGGNAESSRSIFSKCLRAFLMFTRVAADAKEREGEGGREEGERERGEREGGREESE